MSKTYNYTQSENSSRMAILNKQNARPVFHTYKPTSFRLDRRFSIAPMLDWTDRHCRILHRLLSKKALLYTEMIVDQALLHGNPDSLLKHSSLEAPLALQIGGSEPRFLAQAARLGEMAGYDEINLNAGCPSGRVQKGRFGAQLMADPERTADCIEAIKSSVHCPVTLKCRLGIDQQRVEETLPYFLERVSQAGCKTFILHARKAWLQGVSPKENRELPPLDYSLVREMKKIFPHLEIILNGGLLTLEQALEEGQGCDGVMIGRAAYKTPWILHEVDQKFYASPENREEKSLETDREAREKIVRAYQKYAEINLCKGVPFRHLARPLLGLFHGCAGARFWRQTLSENACQKGAGSEVFDLALKALKSKEGRIF